MCNLEKQILERIFLLANAPLSSVRLPDEEVLDLIESSEYDSFSPEFRTWLDSQVDSICLSQGQ